MRVQLPEFEDIRICRGLGVGRSYNDWGGTGWFAIRFNSGPYISILLRKPHWLIKKFPANALAVLGIVKIEP